MQGVTIVETIYEHGTLLSNGWVLMIGLINMIIATLGALTVKHTKINNMLRSMFCITFPLLILCALFTTIHTDKIIDTQYKVSVSDDVSLMEFYEYYDVLEVNDMIFTVKEK